MKLKYAKLWLRKYVKYNNKFDNRLLAHNLNRNVIHLSHRVFKSRGLRGHTTRQSVRDQLQEFLVQELNCYNKKWVVTNPNHGYFVTFHPGIFRRIINVLKRIIIIR